VALSRDRLDVVFCDLVAHTLPVVKLFSRAKILFYCHFPDRLLVPPAHWLSRLYRVPIDRLEAVGTGLADRLLVNSHYTATVFRRSFPRLEEMPLEVLHPGVDCTRYDGGRAAAHDAEIVVLSINRYERKKNLGLAIEALACLRDRLPPDVFASVRLVIAGDCDDRRREARETLQALQALAVRRGVAERVEFLRSCSEEERLSLLARCRCVVYTPAEEHFGFVPLEAMAAGRPVVAVSSGGPLETIEHGHTGMLCPPTPAAFAEALAGLIGDPAAAERMGRAGRLHVARRFSLAAFGARLQAIVEDVTAPRPPGD
jgi:alpha-1,3/alpha-1,6-mannosyltransferase